MKSYDVIIIGAGAAGLMCAWQAGKRGRRVAVLEHTKKVGKKILMSGGGRCNFTNLEIDASNYLCNNPHFVKSALSRYTQWDFIGSVLEHDIAYHERKHGQLFCDDSAKAILKLLLDECRTVGVDIVAECSVSKVESSDKIHLETNQGKWQSQSLVIATGGLSIPSMNTTAFAYNVAKQFGLNVNPLSAGLVPLIFDGKLLDLCKTLAGNAIEVAITCKHISFTENMLFTHRGLSGPSILQISNYWSQGEFINVNLLPQLDMSEYLCKQKQEKPKSLIKTQLYPLLPKALVIALEKKWWQTHANKPLAEISDTTLIELGKQLNSWHLYPSGTEGYKTAEVTLGGIDTDGISSKTMAAKSDDKLFFIGECLDVTGHLGGYNFQWAWSSAYAAAQHV